MGERGRGTLYRGYLFLGGAKRGVLWWVGGGVCRFSLFEN